MQIDVLALCIRQEIRSTFYERYGRRSIVADKDVEQSATADDAD
jgi:hypothetical protein